MRRWRPIPFAVEDRWFLACRHAADDFPSRHPHFFERDRQVRQVTPTVLQVRGREHFHHRVAVRCRASNVDFTDRPVESHQNVHLDGRRLMRPIRRIRRPQYDSGIRSGRLEHADLARLQPGNLNGTAEGSFHILRRFLPSARQGGYPSVFWPRTGTRKVPTVVPSGAENGAIRLAFQAYRPAPTCTKTGSKPVRWASPAGRRKSATRRDLCAVLHQAASPGIALHWREI
jgi:hypothetical protein